MKKFDILFTAFLTLMVFGFVSNGWSDDTPHSAKQVTITAAGSGVNLGITRLLAQAFSSQDHNSAIDVPGSIGSKGAIQAVSEGAIPLGLISRPLKETEKKAGYH